MMAQLQPEDLLQDLDVAKLHVDFMRFSLLLHLYVGAERHRQHLLRLQAIHFSNTLLIKINSDERMHSMNTLTDLTILAHEVTQRTRHLWAQLQQLDREIAT